MGPVKKVEIGNVRDSEKKIPEILVFIDLRMG